MIVRVELSTMYNCIVSGCPLRISYESVAKTNSND